MAKALEIWSFEAIEEALGVASANADELSASIAGLETVLNWPDPGGAPLRD